MIQELNYFIANSLEFFLGSAYTRASDKVECGN